MIVQILQEMLRLSEGSFDWNVIAEPKVKDTFDDFLGAWDKPETEERTIIVKHARVKVDDAKGKGPVDADPTQNDLPLPPWSSRGLKRKQDEDDADRENEHQGEDEYEDEEEYKDDEKRDEKRDESKKRQRGRRGRELSPLLKCIPRTTPKKCPIQTEPVTGVHTLASPANSDLCPAQLATGARASR